MIVLYHGAEDNDFISVNINFVAAYRPSPLNRNNANYGTIIILSGGQTFIVRETYDDVDLDVQTLGTKSK